MILDTETTGFNDDDEIIELAIIDTQGKMHVNRLIQCQMSTIPFGAKKVHGISEQMLKMRGCTWGQIWMKLMDYLADKVIIIYNADYDMRMLRQTAKRYDFAMPELQTHCLMKRYAEYVGARGENGDLRPLRLSAACSHFQVENERAHRALDDCQATLNVLQGLAQYAQPSFSDLAEQEDEWPGEVN